MILKFVSLSASLIFSCFSSVAFAQDTPPAAPATSVIVDNSQPPVKLIVKEGTDVKLKFAQDLSSKTAVDDDTVNLVLDEDLKIGDVVAIKAGAKALATVSNAKKAGMLGKGGEM